VTNNIDIFQYVHDTPLLVTFITGLLLGRKFTSDSCTDKSEIDKLETHIRSLQTEMMHLKEDIKQTRLDIRNLIFIIKRFETDIKSGAI